MSFCRCCDGGICDVSCGIQTASKSPHRQVPRQPFQRRGDLRTLFERPELQPREVEADRHVLEWRFSSPDPADVPDHRIAYSGPIFADYTPWIERTLGACLGEPAPITGVEALAALRVVHAAYESAASGRTIRP